ncbi:PAS domain-containing protein [Thiomicrospira sp. R3]|uniref:PAS domain-containing protein n=1 Tax=Thiomicrospira sp. R3 TaxID=3035472 RepID=UPI00259B47D0|nr:PAS domain-containing protein [Thiomicrospira sp. R3]WFE67811.1 PAS domain-containing protein [Thiomicrospira sp. R3]
MTQRIHIPNHYVLYSTTDLRGTILTASDDFVKISGYNKQEMIGQPHNMIRHPSVPKQVFEDMWATLKSGKTWSATVVPKDYVPDYCTVCAWGCYYSGTLDAHEKRKLTGSGSKFSLGYDYDGDEFA